MTLVFASQTRTYTFPPLYSIYPIYINWNLAIGFECKDQVFYQMILVNTMLVFKNLLVKFCSIFYRVRFLVKFRLKIGSLWFLQNSLDTLEKNNSALGLELTKAQKDGNDNIEKLQQVEEKCSQLQQNLQRYLKWWKPLYPWS